MTFEVRVGGAQCHLQCFGVRVQGAGFRVHGLDFRVQNSGLWKLGVGGRV
jgi:hypothetical protein